MTTTLSMPGEARDRKRLLLMSVVVIAVVVAVALSTWAIVSSRTAIPASPPAPATHAPAPAHTVAPAAPATPAPASHTIPAPAHTVTPAVPVTPVAPVTPAVPVTPSFAGVPTAALAAITSWENANGGVGTWQISSAQSSTVNPAYVLFHLAAAPGHEATFQPGYGFALNTNGSWNVAAYGNADVGCSTPGTTSASMPTAVLAGFGLACPPA